VVLTENDVRGTSLQPFFAINHIKDGHDSFRFTRNHDIIAFAKEAKEILKQNSSAAACCPLLRVDIFETQDRKLVVNEIESLEALVACARGHLDCNGDRLSDKHTDSNVTTFRKVFFVDKIKQLVEKALIKL